MSPRNPLRPLRPLALALGLVPAFTAWSQEQFEVDPNAAKLSVIQVTGNPLGSERLSTPSSVLTGDKLTYQMGASLGETLNGLPGVASSSFGPFASRPIIRGMDGDRVRIMRNGIGALDASTLSQDHAVPQDPLGLDRIEVLRGPAALMYGGNAIGGVVNSIDGRIARETQPGVTGQVQSGFSSANNDHHAGAALDAGTESGFNLHLDGSSRTFQDQRIPGKAATNRYRASHPGDVHNDESDRLTNSGGRADTGSIGSSYTWDHGYTGLSFSRYSANYGSVAEPGVRLNMRQNYTQMDTMFKDLEGAFQSIQVQGSYTDYKHQELEDGEVGTTFKNKGFEGRIEARHAPLGPLLGMFGAEFSHSRFSALGEEAFVPQTDTDKYALFLVEKWQLTPSLAWSFGARSEHIKVDPNDKGYTQFNSARERSFTTPSLSTGMVYQLNPIWELSGNLSYTERAPTFYELFANGPHAATGTYEVGNGDVDPEKAVSMDLGLSFDTGKRSGRVGLFYSHFKNYIGMTATGAVEEDEEGALPVYQYDETKARFYGVEAKSSWQLAKAASGLWTLELGGDYTNAEDTKRHEPLPRIAPLRLRTALNWQREKWDARLAVEHASGQHRVPSNSGDDSIPTAGYTRVDSRLGYHFQYSNTDWLAFVEANNLTNDTIRYATSVLREYSPAEQRNVQVGLKMDF